MQTSSPSIQSSSPSPSGDVSASVGRGSRERSVVGALVAAVGVYEVASMTVNRVLDLDAMPSAVTVVAGFSARTMVRRVTPAWLRAGAMLGVGAAMGVALRHLPSRRRAR